jgi:hypothetical protein
MPPANLSSGCNCAEFPFFYLPPAGQCADLATPINATENLDICMIMIVSEYLSVRKGRREDPLFTTLKNMWKRLSPGSKQDSDAIWEYVRAAGASSMRISELMGSSLPLSLGRRVKESREDKEERTYNQEKGARVQLKGDWRS